MGSIVCFQGLYGKRNRLLDGWARRRYYKPKESTIRKDGVSLQAGGHSQNADKKCDKTSLLSFFAKRCHRISFVNPAIRIKFAFIRSIRKGLIIIIC